MTPIRFAPLVGLFAATSVAAANLLPIKVGSYIAPNETCANANVFYPGGTASIGSPMTDCELKGVTHKGAIYSFTETCTDRQSNGVVVDKAKLQVVSPTSFKWVGVSGAELLRYCGPLPRN